MDNFTPISAAIGGGLIGLAAALLIVLNGRIAGVSGILGGLLARGASDRWERVAFVVGLILGPLALMAFGWRPAIVVPESWPLLIAAGLLVGYGTQLGSGCTSGHGVCGIARLSPRSLVATGIFMAAGVATVFVVRRLVGG